MTTTDAYWTKRANDQPHLQVRITPALYAGPSLDTERAIRPLLDAGAVRVNDRHGNQLVVSSDSRVRLGCEPASDIMWKIAVHESPNLPALWSVSLTESTPVEVVEAITADLAHRLRTGARLTGGAADDEWHTAVRAHGWTVAWDAATATETACSESSPQDTIVLNPQAALDPEEWDEWGEVGQEPFWSVDIGSDHGGWAAAASRSTPDQILHAMVSAMLAPAVRHVADLDDLAVGAALTGAAELTEIPIGPTPFDLRRVQVARHRGTRPPKEGMPSARPATTPGSAPRSNSTAEPAGPRRR